MDQALSAFGTPGARGTVPVSVIIPCYRCSQTIGAAVKSVVDQTARPAEIILVEDCSGDHGQTLASLYAIQQKLQGVIKTIVLRLPHNQGAGEARNAGWAMAGQELIAFLDSDDTWQPRKLEIQSAWMAAHPDYVLTCHDSEVHAGTWAAPVEADRVPTRAFGWRLMLFKNVVATRTVMLRRSVAQRFPAGVRRAEDYQLWLRILLDGGKAARLRWPLACSYKDEFGAGGLSGDLRAMHAAVVGCLGTLRRERLISSPMHLLSTALEVIKYWRRIVLVTLRGWLRN
jgi:glycosyltransferase involved in cell wall biosynthesis